MTKTPERIQLYEHCMALLVQRSEELRKAIDSVQSSANAETKSTAGDKHETARAMAQLEVEMLSRQLSEANKSIESLQRLRNPDRTGIAQPGSVVVTSVGTFFIAVSIANLVVAGEKVIAISPEAPLAKAIVGRKAGEEVQWSGKQLAIIAVSN
ncbi:MAG: hypothetical protein RL021_849 [Bacteroidota bacterium]|jgi:transcription elongation GreA/GreB family factor